MEKEKAYLENEKLADELVNLIIKYNRDLLEQVFKSLRN
jgi:hypothetical protein